MQFQISSRREDRQRDTRVIKIRVDVLKFTEKTEKAVKELRDFLQ